MSDAKAIRDLADKLAKINEGDFDDLNLKNVGRELDVDDEGGAGFSGEAMFTQLGKILDTVGGANPITTVKTDDGQEIEVTPDQARVLRMMLTAEGMKPNIKLQFTKDIQNSATLHDFVDVKDYHAMPNIFMQKYM